MIPVLRTIVGLLVGGLGARLIGLLGRFHVGPSSGPKKTSRRSFTRNAALGAVGVVLAEVAGGFVWFFWPNKTGAFGSEINVAAENVPAADAPPFRVAEGKFFLAQNEDGLLAMYWRCVHLGCTVPWVEAENQFHCPCHGSVYNKNGERIAGPAPRPLDIMAVTVGEGGNVTVDTGAILTRSAYQPEQAVPYTA